MRTGVHLENTLKFGNIYKINNIGTLFLKYQHNYLYHDGKEKVKVLNEQFESVFTRKDIDERLSSHGEYR